MPVRFSTFRDDNRYLKALESCLYKHGGAIINLRMADFNQNLIVVTWTSEYPISTEIDIKYALDYIKYLDDTDRFRKK